MLVPVTDPFTSLEDGIRSLLTSQLDLFVQMGRNLFRGFATILIAWFGVQAALSSAEGGEGVQQKLMRHSDIRTTMNIYGDAVTADMREAHQKVVNLALPR
jgi:integrase